MKQFGDSNVRDFRLFGYVLYVPFSANKCFHNLFFSIAKSGPAVGRNGDIYFGSLRGYFYALGSDGVLKWSILLNGAADINSAPIIGGKFITSLICTRTLN